MLTVTAIAGTNGNPGVINISVLLNTNNTRIFISEMYPLDEGGFNQESTTLGQVRPKLK